MATTQRARTNLELYWHHTYQYHRYDVEITNLLPFVNKVKLAKRQLPLLLYGWINTNTWLYYPYNVFPSTLIDIIISYLTPQTQIVQYKVNLFETKLKYHYDWIILFIQNVILSATSIYLYFIIQNNIYSILIIIAVILSFIEIITIVFNVFYYTVIVDPYKKKEEGVIHTYFHVYKYSNLIFEAFVHFPIITLYIIYLIDNKNKSSPSMRSIIILNIAVIMCILLLFCKCIIFLYTQNRYHHSNIPYPKGITIMIHNFIIYICIIIFMFIYLHFAIEQSIYFAIPSSIFYLIGALFWTFFIGTIYPNFNHKLNSSQKLVSYFIPDNSNDSWVVWTALSNLFDFVFTLFRNGIITWFAYTIFTANMLTSILLFSLCCIELISLFVWYLFVTLTWDRKEYYPAVVMQSFCYCTIHIPIIIILLYYIFFEENNNISNALIATLSIYILPSCCHLFASPIVVLDVENNWLHFTFRWGSCSWECSLNPERWSIIWAGCNLISCLILIPLILFVMSLYYLLNQDNAAKGMTTAAYVLVSVFPASICCMMIFWCSVDF